MDRKCKVKSLKIVRTPYIRLLKNHLPHRNYFDSFLCAQTPHITENGPTRNDFKVSKAYLKFDVPYPVSDPEIRPTNVDPCFDLIKKKKTFLSKLNSARKKYQCDKEWLTKDRVLCGEVNHIPDYLYDLTNGDCADPDIYFNCKYDYYYAGGSLCKAFDGDATAVIYPDLNGNIFCTNVNSEETTALSNLGSGIIYNIKSFENKFLTVRQKTQINLIKIKCKGSQYKSNVMWKLNSPDYPFIDCDLLNVNELCYTDANGNLKLLDLEEGSCKLEHDFKNIVGNNDRLLLAKYLEPDVLSLMGRDFVSLFDSRSAESSVYRAPGTLFHCNNYCGFTKSVNSNYLYVASKHNVLKFDLRQRGIVKKWTHFLSLDPVVIKMGIYRNEEMLCVGSFMETVCFQGGSGNFMPVQLMKPAVAFEECKLRRRMVVREDLERRFRMGTCGAEFVKMNSKNSSSDYAYFTCNSIGDAFRHNLINNSNPTKMNIISPSKADLVDNNLSIQSNFNTQPTSENMDKFLKWVDSVPEVRNRKLASSVANNKAVKKFLLGQQSQPEETADDLQNEESVLENEQGGKLDALLGYIEKYEDHNFASIWGSDKPKDIECVLSSELPQNKVSEWLMKTHPSDSIKEEF